MLPCHDARIPSGTQRSSTAVEYQAIWVMSSIWVEFNENLCGKKAFIDITDKIERPFILIGRS